METTSASSENNTDGTPNARTDIVMNFEEDLDKSSAADEQTLLQQIIDGPAERTRTIIETKEVRLIKDTYQQEHGNEIDNELLVEKEEIDRICCVPVKKGVRWWNLLSIPMIPCTIMLLTTYVNAQTIFLLRDPDFFDVSD